MTDIVPKNPLTFGQSPLTGRIYALRGNKREDVTEEFNRFMGKNAALSSPPADASKMGGERERRLVEALRHVCKHLCQWNDACETGCIVSAALAEMEQKS